MIEIIEYKLLNKSVLKSQVSIRLPKWGGFIIRRIKVFEKDGNRWISMPSEEYEKDGRRKFYPLNEFDTPAMNSAFSNAFFKSYDEYLKKHSDDQQLKFIAL